MFRHQPNFYLLGQASYDYWIGAAGKLEVGKLSVPTSNLGSTYFTYQTSPGLNTIHHLRLVSNDQIELREGATIGELNGESRVSIFTLDPGAFCSTFDNTDMPGMKYHTYDHLGNLRVTYRRAGASLPVDALYEYSPYGRVVQTFQANTHKDRYLSTGHEREEATNYDYRLARLYDAELGRFLGVDVYGGLKPWISPYNYVQNNPILRIDPDGRWDDWVKNKKTAEYQWMDNVTSAENTPQGYKYIGANSLDIVKDIYGATTLSTTTMDVGLVRADDFNNRFSSKGYGLLNATARTKLSVNLSADVQTKFNSDGIISQEFRGINVNASVNSNVIPGYQGVSYSLRTESMTLNSRKMGVYDGSNGPVFLNGAGDGGVQAKFFQGYINAGSIESQGINSINVEFKGLYMIGNTSYLSYPGVFGLSGKPNYTNLSIQIGK